MALTRIVKQIGTQTLWSWAKKLQSPVCDRQTSLTKLISNVSSKEEILSHTCTLHCTQLHTVQHSGDITPVYLMHFIMYYYIKPKEIIVEQK